MPNYSDKKSARNVRIALARAVRFRYNRTVRFLPRLRTVRRSKRRKSATESTKMNQAPNHVFRTVRLRVVGESTPKAMPVRRKNEDIRTREHLTPSEVEALISAAKRRGRYGQRDATAILIC